MARQAWEAGVSRRRQPLRRIFRVPAAVAACSLAGLIVALLGDGAWDWIGALLLSSTVLVACAVRRSQ